MNPVALIAGGSLTLIGLLALALAIGVDLGRRQARRITPRASRRDVRHWKQTYRDTARTGRPGHPVVLHPRCRCTITSANPQRPPVTAAGLSKG